LGVRALEQLLEAPAVDMLVTVAVTAVHQIVLAQLIRQAVVALEDILVMVGDLQ
jgi:hypothetical protein